MCALIRALCLFVTMCCCLGAAERKVDEDSPLARIKLLAAKGTAHGNPELAEYLKSLSGDEMLAAARQVCQEAEEYGREHHDMPGWAAAETGTMLCLYYYFDKVDRDEGGTALLKVVRDRSESALLRRALISRMWNAVDEAFDVEFQAHVKSNHANVTKLLTRILKDKGEPWLVREESMDYLAHQITTEVGKIIRSDPNAHAVWEQTHTFAFVGELVRSGELTLIEETMKALKPLETRTFAYVQVLGAILADTKNEPEELRKHVRRKLEVYRRSVLTGIDEEVEEALRQGID